MANKEKVKNIIKDLMQRLYEAKGFNNLHCDPLDRNMFEAEMKYLWEEVETSTELGPGEREEYEEEIENLKADIDDLKDHNDSLREENEMLWERLREISKVVNDTWS